MIQFYLDEQSGVATYLQLVQQVRHALRVGMLEEGDQLPTAREVVSALAINPNTVLKAYRELEREGLVAGRPGLGTFVLRTLPGPSQLATSKLRRDLERWVRAAREAGLDADDIETLVDTALRAAYGEGVA
jgi:GntR family transcriptional regulator